MERGSNMVVKKKTPGKAVGGMSNPYLAYMNELEAFFIKRMNEVGGQLIKDLPDSLKTDKICKEAVELWAFALQYVPEVKLTEQLCYMAVEGNGLALQFVPKKFHTNRLLSVALYSIVRLQHPNFVHTYIPASWGK